MKKIIAFSLIFLIALTSSFPAYAQESARQNTPAAQNSATPRERGSFDVIDPSQNDRIVRWSVSTAKTLSVVAVGWLLIALITNWVSGQKLRKKDALFIVVALLVLLALRYASFYMTNNFVLLLEYPALFRLWGALRALGGAYIIAMVAIFLTAAGYGLRRVFTKRQISRSGIMWWGLFYSAILFGIMGTSATPNHIVYLALALIYVIVWLYCNPWMIIGQLTEYYNSRGQLKKSIALQRKMLAWPRLSDKVRFVLLNDYASNLQSLGEWHRALEIGRKALPLAPTFQSAEVCLRANLAECYLFLGQSSASVEQCAEIFRLTNTTSCMGGARAWQGACHAMLSLINLQRGWLDEAGCQAALCLEKIPPEAEKGIMHRNSVVRAKVVQANLMLVNQHPKAAARLCRQALKRKPRFLNAAHLRTLYASALLADEKYDEAVEQCNLALTACEKWPDAHFCLGQIYRAQGKEEEARHHFETAISVYPQHLCAIRARQALDQPAG